MNTKRRNSSPDKPAENALRSPPSRTAVVDGGTHVQTHPSDGQTTDALKGVLVYLLSTEAIALKVYAAQNSTSIQQLGTEAFAELFQKHGINGGHLTRVRANRKKGSNR